MPTSRKAIRAGDRGRNFGATRRLGRLIRFPAMTGALIAISTFCRAMAAARFFPSTATPYGQKGYGRGNFM